MKKILVVDDESLLVKMVSLYLTLIGYAVTTAISGEEALSYLRLLRFDLILCDIHMDDMDGFTVLAACKALHPQTKMILCSGDIADETVRRAFTCGADSFLAKPFHIDELRRRINRCLSCEPQEDPEIMAAADPQYATLPPGKLFCA